MEQVKVVLYDDLHHKHNAELVEADASHVLELDGKRVKLDLSDSNYRQLASELETYLTAGSPWDGGLPGHNGTKTRKRSAAPKPDHLMFNQALRAWAAWQGRVAETVVPTGYYYKAKLRVDVAEWLSDRNMTAGEFVARVEAGQYPPKSDESATHTTLGHSSVMPG